MCTHFSTITPTTTNPPLHRRKPVRREYSTHSADLIRFQSGPLNSYRFTRIYYNLSTSYPRLIHNLFTGFRELSTGYPHVIHNSHKNGAIPFPLNPYPLILYYYIIMLYYHCWIYWVYWVYWVYWIYWVYINIII